MMANGDLEGRIFLANPYKNNGLFSCSPLNTSFYIGKNEKGLHKTMNTLRRNFNTYNNVTDRRAVEVRLSVYYLSHGLVRVCDIELSHMSKNNGNPDLVCEKLYWYPIFKIRVLSQFV